MRSEKQLWDAIVSGADLGEDEPYLNFTHHEFQRGNLFLRNLTDLEFPPEIVQKVRLSAASEGYLLTVTGRWATMKDIDLAVGDISWLWKDWLPKDMITLLAAEAGTGKSQLALWLCKCVAEGIPLPDGKRTERNKVIFVDAEAAQVITKERCHNMNISLEDVYVPNLDNNVLAQPDLALETHREQLERMVGDVNPALIVVDSMGGIKSGGENRKEDMQPIMLYLTRLVQNQGCGLLILHHLNKTKREEGEEIALNNLRGSTVIAQFARSVMFMSKKPQGVKLWVGKSNIAKLAEPLKVLARMEHVGEEEVITGFDFEPWEEEKKVTKIEECGSWVVGRLGGIPDHREVSRELFEAGDETWTTRTIKDAGAMLERKGIITRSGGKHSIWSLLQPQLMSHNGNGHSEEDDESLGGM